MSVPAKAKKAPKVKVPKTESSVENMGVSMPIPVPFDPVLAPEVPKKPKAPRKKKQQPTKAEKLQLVSEELSEIEKEINLFKDERPRINGMNVPNIEELVDDEIGELEEEKEELLEVQKETLALPDDPVMTA